MNPIPEDHPGSEEDRLAALFASVDADAAPPDEPFLRRLLEQSTGVFAAQFPEHVRTAERRRRMIIVTLRGLAASLAAAILVTVLVWSSTSRGDSEPTLGKVLENVAQADTLHLEVTREGKTSQVWAKRPDRLRWDEGGGRYKIARADRLWTVDEQANRASSQASPYFRADRPGIDLLDLLELPRGKRESLLALRPAERVRRDGRDCLVYRMQWPAPEGKIGIEALVDAGTKLLRSLEAEAIRPEGIRPLAKLIVLAAGEPVDEELFVVGETLTEDGRIGKVADAQGIVSVKPVMGRRWTPVGRRLVLKPGDWLRTDVRGANAVKLRLVPGTDVVLGPGSQAELIRPNRIRVFQGELKVTAAETPVKLLGPEQEEVTVRGTQVYRLQDQKFVALEKEPLWLQGFEGTAVHESIGSLVATVEGRNVPLTVGFHKVTVDIRDQIARTVIEESFVNHTNSQLEGVFYFPLPEDASISGFGMWIGDELVEADVVEKQRAREIYETILREKRDPGLLEWSGGNMFKARVFPIFARSEKRIKITYTQVLPLRGNRYRYSYALESEMLRQHPLRELSIDVKINSAVPLKSVASPTHATRLRQTKHSAQVEFAAQEYTPTRDFEVVVEVDRRQSDVVLIPHRRGDDGYFMLQLSLPDEGRDSQRDLLPDGEPLELLILADTSASIDADGRVAQDQLIASMLSALTADDTFNLAACDVDCQWAFKRPMPADPKSGEAARRFLADRTSLGWTDLDKAFASALRQSGRKTHVIYVGDGAVTGADCDPVAFSKRLRRLYEGKTGTLHAVAVGSSFEPVVLRTIASLGGGSVRRITGQQGPQAVALELLGEIARPAVRDLNVEFRGLRAARVYPEQLPNLPAGSQHILLGRYLPEGRDQVGEVVVTGMEGENPLRFSTRVSLQDAEQGNSFIPRLWARMHLDSLLDQGASQAIRDEIIALSEEYHIITPYTSLLVLESDEDRERFKVKRRFQMRDAQKFFAEGREAADFELLRQQMKLAGDWRIGLRRAVLQQLVALGRDARMFQPQRYAGPVSHRGYYLGDMRGGGLGGGSAGWHYNGLAPISGPMGGPTKALAADWSMTLGGADLGQEWSVQDGEDEYGGELEEVLEDFAERVSRDRLLGPGEQARRSSSGPARKAEFAGDLDLEFFADGAQLFGNVAAKRSFLADGRLRLQAGLSVSGPMGFEGAEPRYTPQYTQWVDSIFPRLPPPPPGETPKPPTKPWPAAARALAQSLLRTEQLAGMQGGLEIDRRRESFEARSGEPTTRGRSLMLVSPRAWLIRSEGDYSQTTVQWCNDQERGILSKAFQLGRVRSSTPLDLRKPPLSLPGYVLTSLERSYQNYSAELNPQGAERTLLVLKHPSNEDYETHVLIDTARHVILRTENRQQGEVTSATVFGDFVEVAGAWWAGRIENADKKGRRTGLAVQTFAPLTADAVTERVDQELAARSRIQFLREPLAKVVDAKRALAAGKAAFDDQMALLLHFCGTQQWERVMEHLRQAERLAEGKPGLRWVRGAILDVSRRHEELRGRFLEEAVRLVQPQAAGKVDSEEVFLADYVIGQAARFLPPIEMLPLLDQLKPVYERQAPRLHGMRRWNERRADYLQRAGRSDEALLLRRQLAERYPHNSGLQGAYARLLVGMKEYAAAKAWIDRTLMRDFEWHEYEEESLRRVCIDMLRSQGRYAELADYLADWVTENPERDSAYRQYLTALIRADREDEANALVAQWLKEAQVPGKVAPQVVVRLNAAVSLALGQGHNLWTDRLDERWLAPLAEAVQFFARHDCQLNTAGQIMSHHRFRQTDECRQVRRSIARLLGAEIDTLSADQIQRFVGWIMPNDPEIEPKVWKRIAAGLERRWAAESKPEVQFQLGRALVQILSGRMTDAEHLAFLRRQLSEGPKQYRAEYAGQLFSALLEQPWSAEHEDEALGLLERLSDVDEPAQRLAVQISGLYRLTDRMVQARFDARMKQIEHQEKLTRIELIDKRVENLRAARRGLADRLRRQIPKCSEGLARWVNTERLYLETILGERLDQVEQECWEFLGPKPPQPKQVAPEKMAEHQLELILQNRFLITLLNLAARRSADPGLVDRALAYLDQAIAANPDNVRWRLLRYELLVALDRPKDLEQALTAWVRSDDPDNRWRRSLGYLAAEQGRIAEAIKLFEVIEAADELGPADYRALAGWYMAAGRRESHRRAIISAYKMFEEHRLSNWISRKLEPWRRSDTRLPSELDPAVLWGFAAIFEKSGRPQSYLWQLQQYYQATHDFRLLACLADGVVGHSAAKVYPFLQGMDSVLSEVRDEATADSIVEQIGQVRARAETAVDQRALDLLEVLVERRAAELLNQPGPHADKALAALERAFQREWTEGEPPLMADLLAHLGRISHPKLAAEQIRQLTVLHQQQARGSFERMHIGLRLASGLWSYSRRDEAVDLLEAALDEFQDASGGLLPANANDALGTFVSYLESQGHHARGEKVLFEQLEHPVNRAQALWLTRRLCELYEHAIRHEGDVSLGTGQKLYQAAERKILAELDTDDQSHRHQLVSRLCSIYQAAHEKHLAGVVDDLKSFAFQRLPEVLQRQTSNYQRMVEQVAETLRRLAGPHDGLALLVERLEDEPAWLRWGYEDGWRRFGWRLGQWRAEAKQLDAGLEERLLAIVLAELRRDLLSRQSHNRTMYHRHHGHYWSEKEQDFRRAAEEVLAKRKHSGAAVQYIADYLYHGLDHYGRAIEILFTAHGQGILDEKGQSQLVRFLHEQERYGESIAVLEPLVERRPDNIQYRVWLMHAYFRTSRQDELLALLKATDTHFHEEDRWQESAMAALARSCLENELYARSVAYYQEVIPLHQRTQPRRGIGSETLSRYYRDLAQAYTGLGKTAEAVDAAGGAIVCWGPRHDRRAQALGNLKSVLHQAPDLDAYVAALDQETAETGLDKPIVRKAIGQVYLEKEQFDKAITQLQLACQLQPNDSETHQALIACYDQKKDKEGAVGQILRSLQLQRRDIQRYRDLGKRLESLERPKEAERAYTSIVEVLPSESESHALLAEIRQGQDRWSEGIAHWKQVAQIRSLEPTGLLKLAAAQIHQKQWDEAAQTLEKLRARSWPPRFGDVSSQVRNLERQVDQGRRSGG